MEELRELLKIINTEMEEGYKRVNKHLYTTKFKNQLVIIVEDETEIIMDIKNNEVVSADTCKYGSYEDLNDNELNYYLMKYVTWMLEYEMRKEINLDELKSCEGNLNKVLTFIQSKKEDFKNFARKYSVDIRVATSNSRVVISTEIDNYTHSITQVLYI